MHLKETFIEDVKMVSNLDDEFETEKNLDVPAFADTYSAIIIGHLQTAFYLLLLGYVFAVVCFVTEIMWHSYRSKGRGPTGTCRSRTDVNRHKCEACI
jgi:hypothetical protein